MIKDELEDEELKVLKLEETTIKKNKFFESLESKIGKEETNKRQTKTKNLVLEQRVLQKKSNKLQISPPHKRLQIFLETGKCK